MPIYEFTCNDCGAATALRATVAEKTAGLAPLCQACGSTALRQQFRAAGLIGTRAGPAAAPLGAGGGCGPVGCGPAGC